MHRELVSRDRDVRRLLLRRILITKTFNRLETTITAASFSRHRMPVAATHQAINESLSATDLNILLVGLFAHRRGQSRQRRLTRIDLLVLCIDDDDTIESFAVDSHILDLNGEK